MITDDWEFVIIKEMKGPHHVPRISTNIVDFLKRFVNFYLEYFDKSYIRVYGANITPLKLSCYLTDRMVFMEFFK